MQGVGRRKNTSFPSGDDCFDFQAFRCSGDSLLLLSQEPRHPCLAGEADKGDAISQQEPIMVHQPLAEGRLLPDGYRR